MNAGKSLLYVGVVAIGMVGQHNIKKYDIDKITKKPHRTGQMQMSVAKPKSL